MNVTSEYRAWRRMRDLCHNKNTPYYKLFGARGVEPCGSWIDFSNFLKDVGTRPNRKMVLFKDPCASVLDANSVYWSTIAFRRKWYEPFKNAKTQREISIIKDYLRGYSKPNLLGMYDSSVGEIEKILKRAVKCKKEK